MSKIEKIQHAFYNNKRFSSGAFLLTPDGNVYSYDVKIYDRNTNTFHVKKYSSTTSAHQKLTRQLLDHATLLDNVTETEEMIGSLS